MSQEVGIFAMDEHSQELKLPNGIDRLLFRIVGIIHFARRSLIGWISFFLLYLLCLLPHCQSPASSIYFRQVTKLVFDIPIWVTSRFGYTRFFIFVLPFIDYRTIGRNGLIYPYIRYQGI